MDPEPEQLAEKIEALEERLNDKKEQLLEKDLVRCANLLVQSQFIFTHRQQVLEEVTELSDKLKLQGNILLYLSTR